MSGKVPPNQVLLIQECKDVLNSENRPAHLDGLRGNEQVPKACAIPIRTRAVLTLPGAGSGRRRAHRVTGLRNAGHGFSAEDRASLSGQGQGSPHPHALTVGGP